MADITTRAGKGSPLTNNEVDANFTNLNTDKAENGANTDITSLAGITGGVSTADYVDFDTLASGVARATGRLTWNDTDGCLEVGLKGSDVTQQIGQEMVARVYNADSTTIANGEVVYFWSTAGEVIAGKKYIANATIDPHLIVGLATEDIAAGSYGYVTEFGFVRGLDTAAFNPGDILFCSPTVAGAIQSNEPSTPNDVVRIGICLESDSTNGIVLVNPHDVPRADEIRYDNADSGLSSTNVKSAIDELELVKADIALLTSNVTFYLTSANDSVLAGYKQLVTSTLDTNYDEIAFDYLTSSISNTATMLQAWVSDVNVLVGDIAGIVVPIVGNIRKDTGAGDARFYFEVYIRESDGTETLVTTSNVSDYITSTIYGQISLSATVSLQTFTDTDRVVIKLYGQTNSSTAAYELQLGGSSPFRSLFPVPVSVVPSVANAYAIVADTTNFNGKLSSTDNNVQEALETLDDHVHQASEITGLTASNTTTNTSVFNGHLSATDTDIQKALNTLDDVDLQGITDVGATTTTAVTINAALDVDDLKLDGDTISNDGAAVDGNIVLSPKGAGEVDISKVDIDGGAIDGTTIGGTTPGAGTFTDLTVNTTATFAGATIADLGTVTTADINGGTIDGVALDATIADIDNIRIDGNSIISTDGNGNIDLTPNGLGEVNISKVDIAAGEIDGTIIGATVAAAGNFTALDVSTSASFAGATIDDLGTVTTADINGGTIDGADITVGADKTLSVINGTLTLADNQISGDKVHGGIISNFASTGIDDNATSTAITIDSSENVGIGNAGSTLTARLSVDNPTNATEAIRIGSVTGGSGSVIGETYLGFTAFSSGTAQTYPHAWIGVVEKDASDSRGSMIFGTRQSDSDVAPTTAMTIDDAGKVGIGTDGPSEALTVSGSGTSARISLTDSDSVRASMTGLLEFDGTDNRAGFIGYDAGDMSLYAAVGDIKLSTGGAARLTIDETTGFVGIGDIDPQGKLTIDTLGAEGVNIYRSSAAANFGAITFKDTTNTNTQSRIGFNTDTLRLEGNRAVTLVSGGSNTIEVLDDKVGIGKTPTVVFDVDVGSSAVMSRFESSSTSLARQYMYGGAASTQVDVAFFQGTSLQGVFGVSPTTGDCFIDSRASGGGNIIFQRTGNERMRVTSGGFVGIGTGSTVANLLHLKGDPKIRLEDTSAVGVSILDGSDGNILLRGDVGQNQASSYIGFLLDGDSEKARINSSGYFGIGELEPDAQVHISSGLPILKLDNTDASLTNGQRVTEIQFRQNDSTSGGTGIVGRIKTISRPRVDSGTYFGNAADLAFFVSADSAGAASDDATKEALTIQRGTGNVGIGTGSTVNANLHVYGGASSAATFVLNGGAQTLTNTINGGNGCVWRVNQYVPMEWRINSANYTWSVNDGASDAMTLDQSGNLLLNDLTNSISGGAVGTSAKFKVTGSAGSTVISNTGNEIAFSRASANYIAATNSGASIIYVAGSGGSGAHYWRVGQTSTNNMILDGNGNLLVGKTSGASSIRTQFMGASATSSNTVLLLENSANTDLFEVRCDGRIMTGTASASPYYQTVPYSANLWINSSGVLYRTTSSLRYKENIQDMTFGLSDVLALRPVTFEQKNENTGRKFGGFIAEEVHEAGLNEFVEYNDDGEPDAVGYGNMVSLLTKAIQEQQAMIETLQAEVAALKGAN